MCLIFSSKMFKLLPISNIIAFTILFAFFRISNGESTSQRSSQLAHSRVSPSPSTAMNNNQSSSQNAQNAALKFIHDQTRRILEQLGVNSDEVPSAVTPTPVPFPEENNENNDEIWTDKRLRKRKSLLKRQVTRFRIGKKIGLFEANFNNDPEE